MSTVQNTPGMKKSLQSEIDELVKNVRKFSEEFASLKQKSVEVTQEREAAEGKIKEASDVLEKSRSEYEEALDKYKKAEANRLKAAVDIGMSLRF